MPYSPDFFYGIDATTHPSAMNLLAVIVFFALVFQADPSVRNQAKDWKTYLKTLPRQETPILDYRGKPVGDQAKHVAIIPFDVGRSDLQQCADALIRIRSEYLFAAKREREIAFHFTDGSLYSFTQYCAGMRPRLTRNGTSFKKLASALRPDHTALRNYLDIVYAYAGTMSLQKELKPAGELDVGTVIIQGGSPGHCSLIIDHKIINGVHYYQLAEGYMPAQSIYILRNPDTAGNDPWYALKPSGPIATVSYYFDHYELKSFE